jgi:hypothetical protein
MAMGRQSGFFAVEERLRELSAKGDDLDRIVALVDFAMFRAELERAVPRADGAKGGRAAFDHVLMFKLDTSRNVDFCSGSLWRCAGVARCVARSVGSRC